MSIVVSAGGEFKVAGKPTGLFLAREFRGRYAIFHGDPDILETRKRLFHIDGNKQSCINKMKVVLGSALVPYLQSEVELAERVMEG